MKPGPPILDIALDESEVFAFAIHHCESRRAALRLADGACGDIEILAVIGDPAVVRVAGKEAQAASPALPPPVKNKPE